MTLGTWEIATQAKKNIRFLLYDKDEIHRLGVSSSWPEGEEYSDELDLSYPAYITIAGLPGTLPQVLDYLKEVSTFCEYLIKEGDDWYALYEGHKVVIRFQEREMFEAQ